MGAHGALDGAGPPQLGGVFLGGASPCGLPCVLGIVGVQGWEAADSMPSSAMPVMLPGGADGSWSSGGLTHA